MGDSPVRHETVKALRAGAVVEFEGVPFKAVNDQTFQPGVTYIAERNSGPKLLTVREVVREDNLLGGYIVPEEMAYCFDLPECVAVEMVDA